MSPPRPRLKPSTSLTRLSSPTVVPPYRTFLSRYSTSSTTIDLTAGSDQPLPPAPPQRWHSELRTRVGKCLVFGCSSPQISRAAAVLRALATEWRGLLAGSEGFLTGGRKGLIDQKVVWGEMDSFGHVNNVTYFRYAESARVNWITNFAVHADPVHRSEWSELMTPRGTGLIMKSLKGDFKLPMVYPDTISVYHKLRDRPSVALSPPTSILLDCIILSHFHRRVAARMEEDIAIYDYKKPGRTEMPNFMRDLFERTFREQEWETARARRRIWQLVDEVEKLEKETWNREDAIEDMGSAGGGG